MICQDCKFPHDETSVCDCGATLCPFCRGSHSCPVPELTLRGHQVRQRDLTHAALRKHQRVISVGRTGSGKRYLAVWWAYGIQSAGRRVLVVTDRTTVAQQMCDELRRHGVDHGVMMSNSPRRETAAVQVSMIQTLRKRYFDAGHGLPPADWIIVDECHKEPAAYEKLFSYYPDAKIVGLTATPVGPQGRTLVGPDALYDVMVEGAGNAELIRDGWLLRTRVFPITEPDVNGVFLKRTRVPVTDGGEFNQEKLAERVLECEVTTDLWGAWEPYMDRPTVVFAPGVVFCRGLAEQFNARYGPNTAAVIEAATGKGERKDNFKRLDDGELKALVSVDVLREGFDSNASLGIDLQTNHQLRTFVQKTGRIRRPRGTHDAAVWLDLAGNSWRFPHPDEDIDWADVVGDVTTADLVKRSRGGGEDDGENEPRERMKCPSCGVTPLRWRGGECPHCGHKLHRVARQVRTGNGKVREMPASALKKVQKSADQKEWDRLYGMACHSRKPQCRNMTFNTIARLFRDKRGHSPRGLSRMPLTATSVDWDRRVRVVPDEDLTVPTT